MWETLLSVLRASAMTKEEHGKEASGAVNDYTAYSWQKCLITADYRRSIDALCQALSHVPWASIKRYEVRQFCHPI